MDQEQVDSVSQALQQYVNADLASSTPETLKEKLAQYIVSLLLHDMEKLLGILYRVDVNEKKVKELFNHHDPRIIAPGLADLLIEREVQKMQTRNRYKAT